MIWLPKPLVITGAQNTTLSQKTAPWKQANLPKRSHALALAPLPRLRTTLSDLVAYGEMTLSGRVPDGGKAGAETAALLQELRELGWLPDGRVA